MQSCISICSVIICEKQSHKVRQRTPHVCKYAREYFTQPIGQFRLKFSHPQDQCKSGEKSWTYMLGGEFLIEA